MASEIVERPTNGPEKIYLDPDEFSDRCWCEHDSPVTTESGPWIEYVRHDVAATAREALKARVLELEGFITPPEGFDFTVSVDRGKWLVALWTAGKPGGGRFRHGYGETLAEAWAKARAALKEGT